jgi:hypothetical protein
MERIGWYGTRRSFQVQAGQFDEICSTFVRRRHRQRHDKLEISNSSGKLKIDECEVIGGRICMIHIAFR